MTTKSWVLLFLLLITVSVGSVLATRYILQSYLKTPIALTNSETSQADNDRPTVQLSIPEPIISTGWTGYDPAEITCTQKETDTSFSKGCSADFHFSKKHISLPDLGSMADLKDFDSASYAWVAQYGSTTYVAMNGANVVPMGSSGALFINVFDESKNTLNKIFECDSYNCTQLAERQNNLTAYVHRVSDDQGVRIYRDSIYGVELHSSLVAYIPKDDKGWKLGADCGDSQCTDGTDWITVLDQNNFVLRFDKRVGVSPDDAQKIETKYVYVPLQ